MKVCQAASTLKGTGSLDFHCSIFVSLLNQAKSTPVGVYFALSLTKIANNVTKNFPDFPQTMAGGVIVYKIQLRYWRGFNLLVSF